MSDQIHGDRFWLADTRHGQIIEKIVAAQAEVSTPRRIAHMILKAFCDAGYRVYNVNDVGLPGKPGDPSSAAEEDSRRGPTLKVVDLHPPAPDAGPVDRDLVQLLEDALRATREGDLSFVALAGVHSDGGIQAAWAGDFKPVTALATVSNLRIRFEAKYLASTEPDGAA